jgi:hypothetical protein
MLAITACPALASLELTLPFSDAFTLVNPAKAPVGASCAFAQTQNNTIEKESNLNLVVISLLGIAQERSPNDGTYSTLTPSGDSG